MRIENPTRRLYIFSRQFSNGDRLYPILSRLLFPIKLISHFPSCPYIPMGCCVGGITPAVSISDGV
ncbi:hypothetical protein BDV40DRAFT_283736 [Aspergillus tamarii]|uniref:Uncharacterized protein n=1 Tax=Aspergillus tamarii TaxID=41984 RepID=A0A5N6U9Z8_ASPTM|nr:hypothetical protein BDV40DRAFT_283736 [Aspergillus tamarii]